MKKAFLLFLLFFYTLTYFSQEKTPAFKAGEELRYKMSYSGFLRAGTAVLKVEEKSVDNKKMFHATGVGWTSGMIKWFFKVEDNYQSYFDTNNIKPYLFKRKINEGGYKKHRNTLFDYDTNTAFVQDFLKKKDTTIAFSNVQDVLSTFYYLRSYDIKHLKKGDEISVDMFIDAQIYPFKLRYLGKEKMKTAFGKINTLKFMPMVQAGRIFKAQESVTLWITDDANKIPVKMKADLSVGSLRADLELYKGLANPFKKF